ncbi:hypothetical protein [Candidatus Korobacter versatilis]|nr:hypothetical protein [Candidatus Koribacter versatilis]
MANLDSDLLFHRNWWWDPIDMEIFKILDQSAQRQLVAISLEVKAEVLKVQAAGVAKMAGAIAGKTAGH